MLYRRYRAVALPWTAALVCLRTAPALSAADEAVTSGTLVTRRQARLLLGGSSDGAASCTGHAETSLAARAGGASTIMPGASASATAAGVADQREASPGFAGRGDDQPSPRARTGVCVSVALRCVSS